MKQVITYECEGCGREFGSNQWEPHWNGSFWIETEEACIAIRNTEYFTCPKCGEVALYRTFWWTLKCGNCDVIYEFLKSLKLILQSNNKDDRTWGKYYELDRDSFTANLLVSPKLMKEEDS